MRRRYVRVFWQGDAASTLARTGATTTAYADSKKKSDDATM